jgi:hypothetical protein
MNRFQLHDEFGVIRAFGVKLYALNWKLTRPELKLVIIHKPKPIPFNIDNYEECLF